MIDILLTGPALVFLLGVLVFFHELGHFTMAKLLRMRVEEFAFGFGPKWIRLAKRGETEYTVHPIPLGGFVKLAGMEPGENGVPGGFQSKPGWMRFLVYAAGPLMSFVLAYIVFCALGLTLGLPITGKALNRVDLVQPGSRAEKAGLKIGDKIVEINGERIESGNEMVDIIHNSLGKPLTIVVDRGGHIVRIHATPGPGKIQGKTVGLLGFVPTQELKRVGLVDSIQVGNSTTIIFAKTMLGAIFSRDVGKNVGGPIAIADATFNSVKRGTFGYLQLVGMLSMSLGIINLFPIPVVDGGWMVFLVLEGIRRKRFSMRTVEATQRVGWTIIVFLFATIMLLDLSKVLSGQLFR